MTLRIHCNSCNIFTNHAIEKDFVVHWSDNEQGIHGGDKYEISQCQGCGQITFRHSEWFSEDTEPDGTPIEKELLYPPRVSRRKPDWLGGILAGPFWTGETVVEQMLKEIYISTDNSCLRLAAMGIRALLEHIFIDKSGDHGSFKANLDEFFKQGFISKAQREQLEAVIEFGHAASHRFFLPNSSQLKTSMDIVEQIIATVYVHPERAVSLRSSVPLRKPKEKP